MLARSSRSFLHATSLRAFRSLHHRPSIAALLKLPTAQQLPRRTFHASPCPRKGLSPESEEPQAPQPERDVATGGSHHITEPADISADEYHEIADHYIDELVAELEEMAEDGGKGLEVEYSAGVLTLSTPHGTYVLNKQPHNKQIWLSSPISGPKRYDWVLGGADHQLLKEGTATDPHGDLKGGVWVYIRDGSFLTDLLKKEVGIDMKENIDEATGGDGTYK